MTPLNRLERITGALEKLGSGGWTDHKRRRAGLAELGEVIEQEELATGHRDPLHDRWETLNQLSEAIERQAETTPEEHQT